MNAKTHDLTIDYVGIDELIPYERNARKHEAKDIDAIMQSIREFGFNDPIGVWKNNVIIEGHGRLLAAKKLGLDSVPVIHLDHMSDEQRKAYALAHNKTAELSEWDFVVRDEELAAISEIDALEYMTMTTLLDSWLFCINRIVLRYVHRIRTQ